MLGIDSSRVTVTSLTASPASASSSASSIVHFRVQAVSSSGSSAVTNSSSGAGYDLGLSARLLASDFVALVASNSSLLTTAGNFAWVGLIDTSATPALSAVPDSSSSGSSATTNWLTVVYVAIGVVLFAVLYLVLKKYSTSPGAAPGAIFGLALTIFDVVSSVLYARLLYDAGDALRSYFVATIVFMALHFVYNALVAFTSIVECFSDKVFTDWFKKNSSVVTAFLVLGFLNTDCLVMLHSRLLDMDAFNAPWPVLPNAALDKMGDRLKAKGIGAMFLKDIPMLVIRLTATTTLSWSATTVASVCSSVLAILQSLVLRLLLIALWCTDRRNPTAHQHVPNVVSPASSSSPSGAGAGASTPVVALATFSPSP